MVLSSQSCSRPVPFLALARACLLPQLLLPKTAPFREKLLLQMVERDGDGGDGADGRWRCCYCCCCCWQAGLALWTALRRLQDRREDDDDARKTACKQGVGDPVGEAPVDGCCLALVYGALSRRIPRPNSTRQDRTVAAVVDANGNKECTTRSASGLRRSTIAVLSVSDPSSLRPSSRALSLCMKGREGPWDEAARGPTTRAMCPDVGSAGRHSPCLRASCHRASSMWAKRRARGKAKSGVTNPRR